MRGISDLHASSLLGITRCYKVYTTDLHVHILLTMIRTMVNWQYLATATFYLITIGPTVEVSAQLIINKYTFFGMHYFNHIAGAL